jgi:hypothetical protein
LRIFSITASFIATVNQREHSDKSETTNMNSPGNKENFKKITLVKSMSACFILTLSICFTVFSVQSSIDVCSKSDLTLQTDENSSPSSMQCSYKGNEVSWLAWITNKSTSNQFHFLDLLELLTQVGSDEK